MRPAPIPPDDFARIKRLYETARGKGAKEKVLKEFAPLYGYTNPGSLRNAIYKGWVRDPRAKFLSGEKKEAALKVLALGQRISRGKVPPASTLIEWAEAIRTIRPGSINARELNRFVREARIDPASRPYKTHRRVKPNAMHQLDFSVFTDLKYSGERDGRAILQVRARSKLPYVNRPDDSRERVWVGSVVDDASSVIFAVFIVTAGEDREAALKLMKAAWEYKPYYPFWGCPENLYVDQATWGKTSEVRNALGRIGVNLILAEAGKPQGKGKVERQFDELKKHLGGLVRLLGDGAVMPLEEANDRLLKFCMARNVRSHPLNGNVSRIDYWRRNVECWFPDNWDELVYHPASRTVHRQRVRYEGAEYFVPGNVREGAQVELVERGGILYLFLQKDEFNHKPRLLPLEKADVNVSVPGDTFIEDTYEELEKETRSFVSLTGTQVDAILDAKLTNVDFTPPPAAEIRKIEGPGIELLTGTDQRLFLADELRMNLGDVAELYPLTASRIEAFCVDAHPKAEIRRFSKRILAEIEKEAEEAIHELKDE